MSTEKRWNRTTWITAALCAAGFAVALAACESDEPGHTRTTTKETVTTPSGGERTTTTIHEKKTEIYPK
ncbi:MAG TPA: hypothetical protein VHC70_00790 [Phycisphaerales bacterium]|jgi:hypothetical protein|nr:hypothetical protein [Phycisphaerales bacterium]